VPSIDKINVIITQPRRMAAMSMADRVSFERGVKTG
jgi:HrpA-like RNA helicase